MKAEHGGTGATIRSRVVHFLGAVVALAAIGVAAPWLLATAARSRFGGSTPWHGVPAPAAWEWRPIRRALTDQLTEDTIADVVIRLALVVAWSAVIVLLVTIVAEAVHMVRHGGLARPETRGLGLVQPVARIVAAGLLVVAPMLTSPSRALAREPGGPALATRPTPAVEHVSSEVVGVGAGAGGALRERSPQPEPVVSNHYDVRPGDSIYAIAERVAGSDPSAVAEYADRILELNLGRPMPDGRRFDNAALILPGWVLELPDAHTGVPPAAEPDAVEVRVVEGGDTLWSIAEDELGDPERWPEIYDANRGRTFADGRVLDDPSTIRPGWELVVPVDDPAATTAALDAADTAVPSTEALHRDGEGAPQSAGPAGPADPGDDTDPDETVADGLGGPSGSIVADIVDIDELADLASPSPATDPVDEVARPTNRWTSRPLPSTVDDSVAGTSGTGSPPSGPSGHELPVEQGPRLLTLGRAAMLSAGLLTLLAVRRRNRLRRARPRSELPVTSEAVAATERTLRSIDAGDRFLRVDLAVRAAAMQLIAAEARVVAAIVGDDAVELVASGPVELDSPWLPTDDRDRWRLPAAVPVELLAEPARRVGAPCPTLVQLGCTPEGCDLYVDLEALGAVEVGGPGDEADAIVTALAATLAASVLAEVVPLVAVGVDDAAFLGHRHHVPARDVADAFRCATTAVGSTSGRGRSTFELRARGTGGEAWEPAVVLVGAAAGPVVLPPDRGALAVVSASPIHGPSSRLEPDGDAWILRPLGVRLVPVGLTVAELVAVATLVESADLDPNAHRTVGHRSDGRTGASTADAPDPLLREAEPASETDAASTDVPVPSDPGGADPGVALGRDDDLTLPPLPDEPAGAPTGALADIGCSPEPPVGPPPLLVRLLGPVGVESADGRAAEFDRSKAKELVAWLATHRDRSTRTAARTALWELDVRDATFANVVSEARRTLARLVEPPQGEEWVGRTLTEALPLHPSVKTDADLVRAALDAARVQPPEQAIATLRPAVELVVGMPFEGTSYLWPEAEGIASQLVLLATSAAAELAAHHLSMGDIEGVFDATGRGLRVLPGHEELVGLRLRAHAQAGDRAGVRREWEQYERVVDADPWSDGEPSAALVELRRELLTR